MKKIFINGSTVGVVEVERIEETLPIGNYNIEFDERKGEVQK